MFVASDMLAFAGKTNKMFFLPDESFAFIRKVELSSLIFVGRNLLPPFQIIDIPWTADIKQGYEHFMLKEIYEQKKVIQDTVFKYHAKKILYWKQMGYDCSAGERSSKNTFSRMRYFVSCSRVAQYFF